MTAHENVLCAVELFGEDHAHHAVGEGHAGNGEPEIRRLFYAFVHAECAADDERQFRMAGDGNVRKLRGKLLR